MNFLIEFHQSRQATGLTISPQHLTPPLSFLLPTNPEIIYYLLLFIIDKTSAEFILSPRLYWWIFPLESIDEMLLLIIWNSAGASFDEPRSPVFQCTHSMPYSLAKSSRIPLRVLNVGFLPSALQISLNYWLVPQTILSSSSSFITAFSKILFI